MLSLSARFEVYSVKQYWHTGFVAQLNHEEWWGLVSGPNQQGVTGMVLYGPLYRQIVNHGHIFTLLHKAIIPKIKIDMPITVTAPSRT
jgi:hypothetical protein